MVDLENAENAENAGNADSDLAKAEVKEHIWDSGDRIGHLGTEVWVEDSFSRYDKTKRCRACVGFAIPKLIDSSWLLVLRYAAHIFWMIKDCGLSAWKLEDLGALFLGHS